MNYYSPLRYPGGKGKLATYIKAVITENNLEGCDYSEIYAGGAGVALELLIDEYVSSVQINDLNIHIYSFWNSVLNDTESLCRLIKDTTITIDEWRRQKDIYSLGAKASSLERGFATFFLNRTNRSGILNAGVVGGKEQIGTWKLDARFTKDDLVSRIETIADLKEKIKLSKMDGLKFITSGLATAKRTMFTYLDPPYYVKGQGLYDNFYYHDDHQKVADALAKLKKVKWLVSYDDTPQIRKMYHRFRCVQYSLNYSAANRRKGSEVMFFSDLLKQIPSLQDYGYKIAA